MPRYANGRIPESALVIFHRGHNSTDGDFYWGLPPASYQKHLALVARALRRTGRTLSPSQGWSCVRPLHAQELARRLYGNGAAVPGTSSHGGFWEGRDTSAVDYGNWAWVYQNHGGRGAFFEDCRAVGLEPDMISPRRGYPDEPWHVIDLNPWAPSPILAGTDTTQEDDMPLSESDIDRIGYRVAREMQFDLGDGKTVTFNQFVRDTRFMLGALALRLPRGRAEDRPAGPNEDPATLRVLDSGDGAYIFEGLKREIEAVKALVEKVASPDVVLSAEDREAIVTALVAQMPTVDQIVKGVNDDHAERMKS